MASGREADEITGLALDGCPLRVLGATVAIVTDRGWPWLRDRRSLSTCKLLCKDLSWLKFLDAARFRQNAELNEVFGQWHVLAILTRALVLLTGAAIVVTLTFCAKGVLGQEEGSHNRLGCALLQRHLAQSERRWDQRVGKTTSACASEGPGIAGAFIGTAEQDRRWGDERAPPP